MSPSVRVTTETEADRGWWFAIQLESGEAPARMLQMRLDWSDYEHWTRGKTPPSVAAEALLRAALSLGDAADLPDEFDAAALRRRLPGIDERVRAMLATDLRGLSAD